MVINLARDSVGPLFPMDEHRQQLVAAAEAMRAWVHLQKAGWNAERHPTFTSVPAATMTPAMALPEGHASAECEEAIDAPLPVSSRRTVPSFNIAARAGTVLHGIGAALSYVGPVAVRSWKPALASLAIIAMAGLAKSSWPSVSRVVKSQLKAAGDHVSVFERAKATPPPPVAKANVRPVVTRRVGRLHVETDPPGAHVVIDGKDRGLTPLTISEIAVGPHKVLLTSDAGSVQQSITVTGDKTTQLNEAIYSGWLHVSSSVELELSEQGKGLRLDESNQVLLPPGMHDLRFENRRFAFSATRQIEVRPGDTTSIVVDPPASKLSITASTPAEVVVDGTLVGGTPLTDFALQVGTREIVVRNASGGERRSTVTVTVDPLTMHVDFTQP